MAPSERLNLPLHFRNWNVTQFEHSDVKTQKRPTNCKQFFKRPLGIAILAVIVVIVLVVIIVPLAVLLPKKGKHNATLLLPLYIYPSTSTTWKPLYDSLDARPNLKVMVIINPSSGPGSSPFPDERYSEELIKLSAYPNVECVGYVRTGYATRNISDVLNEVSVYGGWASRNSSFAMRGIFFDESPHQYSSGAVEFMLRASQAVKSTNGLQGKKVVIRNPGVIPDTRFKDSNTDISVVFEEAYSKYQTEEANLKALHSDRSEKSYMVHSVPQMKKEELRSWVDGLSRRAEFLFVSTNDEDYYESFGSDWADFTDVLPA